MWICYATSFICMCMYVTDCFFGILYIMVDVCMWVNYVISVFLLFLLLLFELFMFVIIKILSLNLIIFEIN